MTKTTSAKKQVTLEQAERYVDELAMRALEGKATMAEVLAALMLAETLAAKAVRA